MINVNELRIGNFIFDDEGIIAKVIGFNPYDHSVRCDEEEGCELLVDLYPQDGSVRKEYAVDSTSANPIPLTHEWLERCGFKNEPVRSLAYKGIRFTVFNYNEDGVYRFSWGTPNDSIGVQYLHQLQNLYYALTGEEHIIKLP